MKNLSYILFFVVLIPQAFAQDIDSLKLALKNAKHDSTRCNILNELAETASDEEWPVFNEQLKVLAEKNIAKNEPPKTFYLKHLADALNNIGFLAEQQGDIPKALEYYHKSLQLREEMLKRSENPAFLGELKNGLAQSLNNIGAVYYNQGDIPKALEYYHKSLQLREEMLKRSENPVFLRKLKNGIAQSLNNIGVVYYNQGDIPKALEYYHKSLQLEEEMKNKQGIALSLNNIGSLAKQQGNISKALDYYHKSLQLWEEMKNKQGIASSLNNIGLVYYNQGDPLETASKEASLRVGKAKALEYYHKSLQLHEEIKDKNGIATSLNNIGLVYYNQGDPLETASKEASLRAGQIKALEYYHKSLQLREEIKDKNGITHSLNNIASAMLQKGLVGRALEYAKRSLQVAKELGYPDNIKNAASTLKKIYKKQHNYKEAFVMYELEIQMNDSITNEATKKASIQKQFQYEYEKKAAADSVANVKTSEIKNAQIAQQQAELKAKKNQQYGLYGGLILVIAFAAFMYNRFKVTQKQKAVIERQKEVVEKAHELLEEKNSEILASIRYAKRIQDALMTSQRYIERNLNRLKS